MIDVIVYKPEPEGESLYMINPSGYALGFIIYHIKHERVYVSYKHEPVGRGFIRYHINHERIYVL